MTSMYDELRAIAAEETSRAVGFRVKGDDFGVGPVVARLVDALMEPTEAMLNAVTYVNAMPATKRAIWQEMLSAIKDDT